MALPRKLYAILSRATKAKNKQEWVLRRLCNSPSNGLSCFSVTVTNRRVKLYVIGSKECQDFNLNILKRGTCSKQSEKVELD
jgi:hypothetical protein